MHPTENVWVFGGLQHEPRSVAREREHLIALQDQHRPASIPLLDRLRGFSRTRTAEPDLVCCAA
jgi:hypothetical protein